MKQFATFFLFLIVYGPSQLISSTPLQQKVEDAKTPAAPRRIPLKENLLFSYHPTSTANDEAQSYFDQGLVFIYGFNHEAALQSFKQASLIDPDMAMAYWGMALAVTPILDTKMSPEDEKKGYDLMQKALQLSSNVTENERMYIEALAARYTNNPKPDFNQLASNYKAAMKKVMDKYPDDLDASTLYAESVLNIISNKMWKPNGEPENDTPEVLNVLESVIKKDPNHMGANHLYIHAMEDSKHPEKAMMSALVLGKAPATLTHLIHMPSHIYMKTGDYHQAIQVNEKAVKADYKFKNTYGRNEYFYGSITHNLLFLIRAYAMAGYGVKAKRASEELRNIYEPRFKKEPGMEFYYTIPYLVLISFNEWNDILKQPAPPKEMKVSTVIWLWSKAAAYASLGDEPNAKKEQENFKKAAAQLPADAKYGSKPASKVFELLGVYLDAQLLDSNKKMPEAIQQYQKAVQLQDAIGSSTPLEYLFNTRDKLGQALLADNQFTEAEVVFREDLGKHPRSGRSLYGLFESLNGQNRETDAFWIGKMLDQALQGKERD